MKHPQSGFAALFTIVIIGAACLIMALNAALLGIGELDLSYLSQQGSETFYVADGCWEETLARLRLDPNYGLGVGVINLTATNGACQITIADPTPPSLERTVEITASLDNYSARISSNLTLSTEPIPRISVNDWHIQ